MQKSSKKLCQIVYTKESHKLGMKVCKKHTKNLSKIMQEIQQKSNRESMKNQPGIRKLSMQKSLKVFGKKVCKIVARIYARKFAKK